MGLFRVSSFIISLRTIESNVWLIAKFVNIIALFFSLAPPLSLSLSLFLLLFPLSPLYRDRKENTKHNEKVLQLVVSNNNDFFFITV